MTVSPKEVGGFIIAIGLTVLFAMGVQEIINNVSEPALTPEQSYYEVLGAAYYEALQDAHNRRSEQYAFHSIKNTWPHIPSSVAAELVESAYSPNRDGTREWDKLSKRFASSLPIPAYYLSAPKNTE